MSHGKHSRFPLSSKALAGTGRTVPERFLVVFVEASALSLSDLRLQVHSATFFFFLFARAPIFFAMRRSYVTCFLDSLYKPSFSCYLSSGLLSLREFLRCNGADILC